MSNLINQVFQNIKQQQCSKPGHDNLPIIRICVNDDCQIGNDFIHCTLCADCLIDHSSHYSDCIKLDQFTQQCQKNFEIKNEISNEKLESVVTDLNSQAKNLRKKFKEMQSQFKKQFKQSYNTKVIEQLRQLKSKVELQEAKKKTIDWSMKNLVKEYKGYRSEESQIDFSSLFNKVLKQSEEFLNANLVELSNLFIGLSEKVEKDLFFIKDTIDHHANAEIVIEQEEKQKNIIKLISISQEELESQIKNAVNEKDLAQKDAKRLQDLHFDIQEQEKILFYKIEQKKKLDSESKRSFNQKLQNLMEKQINIKYMEEQRIQFDGGLQSQMFLQTTHRSPNIKVNDIPVLIQDQDQSFTQEQFIVQQLQFGSSDVHDTLEQSMQQEIAQIDKGEKQKYTFIEKTKVFLQQRQEYFAEIYQKEIQSLQNLLIELQNKKEKCVQNLEEAKNKYSTLASNLRELQLQSIQTQDQKYSEKRKMLDLYKKSPIKRKVLNF